MRGKRVKDNKIELEKQVMMRRKGLEWKKVQKWKYLKNPRKMEKYVKEAALTI